FTQSDAEMDALAMILEKGKSSRLHRRLVRELQIAQDVSAYQGSMQLASEFGIIVTLRKGKDPEEALKVVDEELDKLRTTPPTETEVERARAQLLAHLIFDHERVTARANLLNHYNQFTGDPGFFEKDVARYQALKATDLVKAAASFLPSHRRVITIVTPTSGAPRAGRLVEVR
ncbi:MAG: insulinase family protein, partial [Myxococcales bacterium]|nr:insulinase family protein [Polyangiaceae bacterium]MDW8251834.1 insulinase family protein [Myxococcales bacterium]